jgi:ketosteroid isomerase-like protein
MSTLRLRMAGACRVGAMLLGPTIGCACARPPVAQVVRSADEQQHEAAVRRYFREVWSEGHLEVLDQLLTEDYVNHTPSTPNPAPGPGGLKPIVAAFRQAFPDLQFALEDVVVEGDRVAVRVRMQGTHMGPLFGLAATQRRVSVEQVNIELFRGDRIAEHWRVTDELGLMHQLGVAK